MTKQAYKGIVFDLFGTLALWHPDRLPTFEWQGKTQPSTMGELRHTVAELVTEVPFETFYETFMRLNEELLVEKSDGKEIPSHQRFLRTLRRLDYPDSSETAAIAEKLSLTHMDLLASAVEIPQHYAPFLAELAKQYLSLIHI